MTFSWQDKNWAEFSTLEEVECMTMYHAIFSNTAYLRVGSLAQTAFKLSPVRYHLSDKMRKGSFTCPISVADFELA
jgi:hypothetical protein